MSFVNENEVSVTKTTTKNKAKNITSHKKSFLNVSFLFFTDSKKTWKWPVFIILKIMFLSIDTLRHEVTIQSSTLKKIRNFSIRTKTIEFLKTHPL